MSVELLAGGRAQRRWIHGGSYQSSDAPVAYFGLGGTASDGPVNVRVTWPGGGMTEYFSVPLNRKLILTHGNGEWESMPLEHRPGAESISTRRSADAQPLHAPRP
jgi:hypothetical protein